jgi:Mg2+-importing ATPase
MTPPVTRRRFAWRRSLFVVLCVVVVAIVASQFTSAEALGADLSNADPAWVAVAVLLHGAFFVLYGGLYAAGFRAVGVSSGALRLVPVMFASIFAKTAVPFTAAPAAAVFIDDAMARGQSGPRTAVGVVVTLAVDLLTALPFVLAGTVALVMRDRLVAFGLLGTAVFVVFIGGVLATLVLAARMPRLLERLLAACGALVNRAVTLVGRPAPVPDGWARNTTKTLAAAVTSIPGHPRDIAIASGYGLLLHLANLAGLGALFLAFGQGLDLAALAAGFGMSIVFFIIAIVPDGVGAVEGAMALVFVQLGMPATAAILVTLAYRILNVWLPVAIGFWCARRLRLFGATERVRETLPAVEPESL